MITKETINNMTTTQRADIINSDIVPLIAYMKVSNYVETDIAKGIIRMCKDNTTIMHSVLKITYIWHVEDRLERKQLFKKFANVFTQYINTKGKF